jgi:acyl carrier protein
MGEAMNRTEILEGVVKILRPYEGRGATRITLTESTLLSEDLDIDSARLVDVVLDVESKFGVTIDDASLTKIKTVGDVVELVDGLVKAS